MDSTRWGWSCMLQLQEADNWEKPAATSWAAEFLLIDGESREFLGSWINSSAVHEAKKRRAKQVITCSFPCGKWLHMIGARASPGCELCKRERNMDLKTTDVLPTETVAHIHSHTPPRTRSPSSHHPPFTHYPFPLRSLVCGDQPSPHKSWLVVSHSTCPPLSTA
jgi:hypothetical protein